MILEKNKWWLFILLQSTHIFESQSRKHLEKQHGDTSKWPSSGDDIQVLLKFKEDLKEF